MRTGKRGAPVVCIDARTAHKVLSARMNKSDKSEVVGLAQLAHTGWYGDQGDQSLQMIFASLITLYETVCLESTAIDAKVQHLVKNNPLALLLTSIPGVGPIVSLSFIATIDDEARFRKAPDVSAYLGMPPRRSQSGETNWSGRI